jgi:hypothetical protein
MTEEKKKITPEFIFTVKNYVNLDNQIKSAQVQIREWRRQKEAYAQQMMTYMEKNDMTKKSLDFNGGSIKYMKSKRIQPVSQKHIKVRLVEYFKGDKDKAQEFWKFLEEGREVKEHTSLRRYVDRVQDDDDDSEED